MTKPIYIDISSREEDDRIEKIGYAVMKMRRQVGFVTDADPGKAERYIKKLRERFPGIRISDPIPGPVAGAVQIICNPPDASDN